MSCRTTAAGSALTSFARISDGPGVPLSDVSTLSLFHSLRREYHSEVAGVSQDSYFARRYRDANPEGWERDIELNVLYQRLDFDNESDDLRTNPDLMYQRILEQAEAEILADTTLTEARKASLLARINAAKEAETPDFATIYAIGEIRKSVRTARSAQLNLLSDYTNTMGVTREEALAKYRELENSIDRARSAETDSYYTSENREAARQAGIVDEAGAVKAFIIMKEEIRERRLAETSGSPRLIDTYNTLPSPSRTSDGTYELIGWGQDRLTGHTEFQVKNLETGEIEIKKYRISGDLSRAMSGNYSTWRNGSTQTLTPADYWLHEIANRGWHEYHTQEEAELASAARRCALCGQFASISHTCPDRFANAPRYVLNTRVGDYVRTSNQSIEYEAPSPNGDIRTGTFTVDLPLVNDYRRAFREHGVILLRNLSGTADWRDRTNEVNGEGRSGSIQVRGDLALIRQEDGTIQSNTDSLTCSCAVYRREQDCIHVKALVAAAIKRTIPPQRSVSSMTPEERERLAQERQARIEASFASDWTRREETLAEARKLFQENSEVSYFDNFNEFNTVYKAAKAEKEANGKVSLAYAKEKALNGLATRESGQGFGVEIEYDYPETMTYAERAEADRKIGLALKAANIIPTENKQGYHAAAQKGYKDVHVDSDGKGTWSWEHDGSVAGEIVTPTMYDEPETWEKLEKVVQILRDNGAIPSNKAGAHIHVGTGRLFGSDPAKYAELARIYSQHEDVIYRLATDPERGTHRGVKTSFNYSSPNPGVSPSGFADATAVRRWQGGYRTRALNLNGVQFNEDAHKSHVEFRLFDATLDPGAIQAQIKLAVSMTNAAARAAELGGTTRNREQLGVHSDRLKSRGRRRPTDDDIKDETSTLRSLLDTLFSRKEDKEQATKVFAATSWIKLTAAQKNRFVSR